ncbi:MAG: hypothetical protein ABR515_05800 [Nitrososphaeraceae archaeon]
MPEENIAGPTVLWTDLEDREVKSNDGKKLGKIKRISQNHIRMEKGSFNKSTFWIPKNLADAYDGKYLWLNANKEEIHDKFFYGEEPAEDDKIAPIERIKLVKERMAGVSTNPDTSKPYKDMRDLK